MKIYITRHGQVCPTEYFGNADFPMFDIPLSTLGQKQAEHVAKVLKSRGFNGKIYSSPYRRTMMTAEATAKACNLPVFPEQALREILKTDEGAKEFEGMTIEQLRQEFSSVPGNAMLSYPWWKASKDTKETVIERVSVFWETLLQSDCEEVLLVGHGATVFGTIFYLNQKFGFGFPEDKDELGEYLAGCSLNCALSYIETAKNGNFVRGEFFNTEHLTDEMLTSNPRLLPRPGTIIV